MSARRASAALLVLGAASAAASADAQAYRYRTGEIVEGNPTQIESGWVKCRVLEQGPGPGAYKTTCLQPWSREKEYWTEGYTKEVWMRPMSAAAAAMTPAQVAAAGGVYKIGQTVLGAPAQIDATWTRCEVLDRNPGMMVGGRRTPDQYKMNCAVLGSDAYGAPMLRAQEAWIPETWMKADRPGFHPDWTLAATRGQEAARLQRIAAAGRPAPQAASPFGGGLKAGEYACYGSGGRIMIGLGFKVLPGGGRYTDLDGKSPGLFVIAGDKVTFRGGHLGGQTGRDLKAGRFTIGAGAGCEPF